MTYENSRSNLTTESSGGLETTVRLGFESKEDLLNYLKGKRVLDLGSGAGMFAKQAYETLGSEVEVVSVNPRLAIDSFIKEHKARDRNFGISEQGVNKYAETSVAASWDELPFEDGTFDVILATKSFLYETELYSSKTMANLINLVKKESGELRLHLYNTSNSKTKDAIKIADEKGCRVELFEGENNFPYIIIRRGTD